MSFYRQGEFLDLCRGPHVPSAGAIGAVKLLSIAGAYWKGDASKPATAASVRDGLVQPRRTWTIISTRLEEAKRRDHRVLGKQLELFLIEPDVGFRPGLVAAQGGDGAPRAGGVHLPGAAQAGIPAGLHRRRSAGCNCTRRRATIPTTPTCPVPAGRNGRRRPLPACGR